jgi:CRP-like cAMP-binding protein
VQEDKISTKIFIVESGEVELLKKISFRDIHENLIAKVVCISTAREGEIIGEDSFRLSRKNEEEGLIVDSQPCFCSAKSVGREGCIVYEAYVEPFLK